MKTLTILASLILLLTSCQEQIIDSKTVHEFAFVSSDENGTFKEVKLWESGQSIKIGFLANNGTKELRNLVKEYASPWTRYANLNFSYGEYEDGVDPYSKFDVIVSFSDYEDSSSGIGKRKPTFMKFNIDALKLRSQAKRTILHEFGHMLGLDHENKRDDRPMKINPAKAYNHYRKTNNWSKKSVENNVLRQVSEGKKIGDYDLYSIMHYHFHEDIFDGEEETSLNENLSLHDKKAIAQLYPGRVAVEDVDSMHIADNKEISEEENLLNQRGICEIVKNDNFCEEDSFTISFKLTGEQVFSKENQTFCGDLPLIRKKIKEESFQICDVKTVEALKSFKGCKIMDKDFETSEGASCSQTGGGYPVIIKDGSFLGCVDTLQQGYQAMKLYSDECGE